MRTVKFAITTPADHNRLRRLRRMQAVALSLLIAAAVVYLLTVRLDQTGVWGWVNTAAEAAMVGGLADWFAVTALFRHPLGIPIPHTAIIPRKKDAVATSLQDFFADNFLTETVVRERISDAGIAARLGRWLAHPENARRVVTEAIRPSRALAAKVSSTDVVTMAHDALIPRLTQQPISAPLGRLLGGIVADGKHLGLVDLVVNLAGRWVLNNPERAEELLTEAAPRWAPRFINKKVAGWGHEHAVEWLLAVRNTPDHPARIALDDFLARIADDLEHDTAVARRVEYVKEQILTHPQAQETLVSLWGSFNASLQSAMDDDTSPLWTRTQEWLSHYGATLAIDPAEQRKIDGLIADLASFFVNHYGREASAVISATIKRWDGEETSRKIELHVGRDLQYIRINGTVVGALAGLVIHAVGLLVS